MSSDMSDNSDASAPASFGILSLRRGGERGSLSLMIYCRKVTVPYRGRQEIFLTAYHASFLPPVGVWLNVKINSPLPDRSSLAGLNSQPVMRTARLLFSFSVTRL